MIGGADVAFSVFSAQNNFSDSQGNVIYNTNAHTSVIQIFTLVLHPFWDESCLLGGGSFVSTLAGSRCVLL